MKTLFGKKVKTKDQRRFKRMRLSYLVKYQVNGKGEPRITNARDISAGGIKFWTKEDIPESSLLKVTIFLPPLDRSVEALAQVLRIRRMKDQFIYYAAVSFLDIREEDREEISAFADSLSKDKSGRFLIDHANIVVRNPSKS